MKSRSVRTEAKAPLTADDADFAAAEGVATGAVAAAQTEADTADPKIASAVATSAQAEADKAAAEASWQTTATSDEEQYVSTVSGDEVAYASDNAAKFLVEAHALDAADQTAADAAADATQGLAGTLAGDEVAFETTAASATDGFQVAMANAQSAYDIAMATASLNLANGGSTADFNTAVTTAAAGLATAQGTAASVYRGLVGPADALQTTDDADAVFLAVKTTADAVFTDATTADAAIDTYSKAESDDYDQQTKDDAQSLETLQVSDADGEAAAIHSEDGADPSPWLNEMSAQALAAAGQIDALAPAQQTLTDAMADAQAAYEKASADAAQTDADAVAKAWHDQTIADAQADQNQAIAAAGATSSLSSGGAYAATLPDSIFAAFDASGDPATLSADFTFADNVNDVSLDGAGWSYSVASTGEDFTILPGTAAAESSDLVDNPPYAPPNPYANLFQFHLPGDPGTGGSGGGGTQPPSGDPETTPPPVPPTNPQGTKTTGKQLEGSSARPGAEAAATNGTTSGQGKPAPTKPSADELAMAQPKPGRAAAQAAAKRTFSDETGPVKIVGIVGRFENPPIELDENGKTIAAEKGGLTLAKRTETFVLTNKPVPASGMGALVEGLDDRVTDEEGVDAKVSHDIYGSSNGLNPNGTPDDMTEVSKPSAEIAAEQFNAITAALNNGELNGDAVYRLVVIGHSWGADKSIEVLKELKAKIDANPALDGKVKIYLFLMDSINRKSPIGAPTEAKDVPVKGDYEVIFNLFEIGDDILPGTAYEHLGEKNNLKVDGMLKSQLYKEIENELNMRFTELVIAGNLTTKQQADLRKKLQAELRLRSNDTSMYHEFLPKVARETILIELGILIPDADD